ncbi:MAG: hypothetical protein ACRDRR_21715 [Pseudonocardiaceae bacterium]
MVVEDIQSLEPRADVVRVVLGDGRRPELAAEGEKFDWIIFSPPYPNNIDYTEVYKTEAWALGFYETAAEMRAQRMGTIRSHPSVKFPDAYWYEKHDTLREETNRILQPLLDVVPKDRYRFGRVQILRGYADDMLQVLTRCRALATDSGFLAFVVGNSVHGSKDQRFVIAADLLICALAELAGWEVEEIRVARFLHRRGVEDDVLRESVVILRLA